MAARRDKQMAEKPEKSEKPAQPTVAPKQAGKLVIVRKSEAARPRVTLPRRDGIVVCSDTVYISSPIDVDARIETRKREILMRERLSDSKTPESRYWAHALAQAVDASSVCL